MLTDQENYRFDVFGYMIIPNVLTDEEVDAYRKELSTDQSLSEEVNDSLVHLRDHPVLAGYLEDLIVEEHQLIRGPWLLGKGENDSDLIGGNEPRSPSRSYFKQNDVRFCQGVLAIWALSDVKPEDGGLGFVPASHKSYVETPGDLVNGTDDMGLVRSPELKAGDLLLCAETVLHRLEPSDACLVAFGFASDKARRIPPENDLEDWMTELTPIQQAVIAPLGDVDKTPVILSDGTTCDLLSESDVYHPSIYVRDKECPIDEKELYHWDLCGHLVLHKVMDDDWLAAANEAVDACADQIHVGGSAAKGSPVLAGTGVPSLSNLFELPKPHCDPFRKMIAHPAVIQRLNWMMGSGFRCRSWRAICSPKGTSGHGLHSFADPARPVNTYVLQNGRTYCDSINVAWQLRDVCEADGGFVCIPGSHKARYPSWPELITCEDEMDMVTHVGCKAGDVVMFMGAAQSHGAYPWKSDIERRNVLLGYSSRNIQ